MRNRLFVFAMLLILIAATTNFAFAEDSIVTPTTSLTSVTPKPTSTGDRRGKSFDKLQDLRDRQQKKLLEFQTRIATKEAELKDKIASREGQLKAKLEAFKDKKKAEIAQRVNTNLNHINLNRVRAMTANLNTMDNLLTKVKTKTAEKSAGGTDVTSINTAIASADAAIAAARTALETQAGKDYSITVSTETTVHSDAKTKRDQLLADLKAVHEKVKLARKALIDAIKAAYGTLGKDIVDGGTGSVTPTVTGVVTGTVTLTPTSTVTGTPTAASTNTPTTSPTETATPTP